MSVPAPAAGASDLVDLLVERLDGGDLALPPLPAVAQQVLSLVSDEQTSAEALAVLVQRDAGLASTLVRHANTAALGGVVRIVSVQQAVSRLGMRRVAELAVSVSLRSGIGAGSRYRSLLDACWRRSLATGLFAKEIARVLRHNVEVAFLCGLLRGVGRPLALHALSELLGEKARPQTPPAEAAAAEVAEALAAPFASAAVHQWHLPETVAEAIQAPGDVACRSPEASTAALAERLADVALAEAEDAPAPSLAGDEDARALDLYADTLESLQARGPELRAEVDAL